MNIDFILLAQELFGASSPEASVTPLPKGREPKLPWDDPLYDYMPGADAGVVQKIEQDAFFEKVFGLTSVSSPKPAPVAELGHNIDFAKLLRDGIARAHWLNKSVPARRKRVAQMIAKAKATLPALIDESGYVAEAWSRLERSMENTLEEMLRAA